MDSLRPGRRVLAIAAAASLALLASGCINLSAQLLYLWKGETIPAEFSGLRGKRVAVVCVADSSAYGPGEVPTLLAQQVESILTSKVKDIELVPQDEVADWIDRNNWNEIDYRQVGSGVKADMIVAIDVESLRLHEGQTLYRGRATVKTTVYDLSAGGTAVYTAGPREFVFPQHTAIHAADKNENEFRRLFLQVLARDVARRFYDYDLKDDFSSDAAALGG